MRFRNTVFVIASAVLIVASVLLVRESPLLARSFLGLTALPVGTLVAWAGLVALSLSVYAGLGGLQPRDNLFVAVLAFSLKLLIFGALVWAPVSYWLAGNFAFEFVGNEGFRGSAAAFFVFLYYSSTLVVAPPLIALLYGLVRLLLLVRGIRR